MTASVYLAVPSGSTSTSVPLKIANTGDARSASVGSTTATNLTTTWQRFYVTGTNMNGLTSFYFDIGSAGQITPGNPIYVWGVQLVLGTSAGNYDPSSNTGTAPDGDTVTLAPNGLFETYAYDSFGNMVSAGNFNFVQSYTTSNQLSGWNYDAGGNLLIDSYNNGYTYDAEGRISGEGQYIVGFPSYTFNPTTTYVYDAAGNRVEKSGSTTTDYIDFGGREIARLTGGQWTDLIYGVGGLLAEVPGTQGGAPVYRMVDHLGSVVGTLDTNGVLLSQIDYAPFGQVFAGGTVDPYLFTGKERDAESGLDDFGARYYASTMGRFMSPDWSSKDDDPVPYAKLDNPQSLNLYTYGLNNPLSRVDSDGHMSTDVYVADLDKHGGAHIDRYNKNGQNVGRYRTDGTPMKFKGKLPAPVPNSDKGKFEAAKKEIEEKQQNAQQYQDDLKNRPGVPAPPVPDGLKPDPTPNPKPIPVPPPSPNPGPNPGPEPTPIPFPGPAPEPMPIPEPMPLPIPEPIPFPFPAAAHVNNL